MTSHEDRKMRANLWKKARAEEGNTGLADVLLDEKSWAGMTTDFRQWFEERTADEVGRFALKDTIIQLLCSIPAEVLDAVMDGNLPERCHQSKTLRDWHFSEMGSVESPGCYIMYIADRSGNPPTVADCTSITGLMSDYINQTVSAAKRIEINTAISQTTYDKDRYVKNNNTRVNHAAFIDGLNCRVKGLNPSDLLDGGLTEVGWSITPRSRIQQHKDHINSNYIMNLFEACAMTLFSNKYRARGYIVLRLTNPTHVQVGEIITTYLSQAWLEAGYGFTHAFPGDDSFDEVDSITPFGTGDVDGWLELGVQRNMEGVEAEIERLEKDASARNELLERAETAYEELIETMERRLAVKVPEGPKEFGSLAEDDWVDDVFNM